MVRSFLIIILLTSLNFYNYTYSQITGTILYLNGTIAGPVIFNELHIKLHYYAKSADSPRKIVDPGEYEKQFSLERLNQINFIYEKESHIHDFYYLLTLKGTNENNTPFVLNIKAWDWLEVSSAEETAKSDTRIIFFYKEKKVRIDRIIFNTKVSREKMDL